MVKGISEPTIIFRVEKFCIVKTGFQSSYFVVQSGCVAVTAWLCCGSVDYFVVQSGYVAVQSGYFACSVCSCCSSIWL
jgi:hypothetical protein